MREKGEHDVRDRRVAIIGSGLAGLTTAYLLRREGCEVWLIEKSDRLGFHSASVEIPLERVPEDSSAAGPSKLASNSASGRSSAHEAGAARQRKWIVDVPMRSFQGGYYPLLIALYKHLGLRLRETFYTFSFSHLYSYPLQPPERLRKGAAASRRRDVPYFIYSGASGLSLPALPSKYTGSLHNKAKGVLMFLGIAFCQVLFLVLAFLGWHDFLPWHLKRESTLRQLTHTIARRLERPLSSVWPRLRTPLGSVWEQFIADLVIPLFGSVGTMTVEDVWETRIGCLLDYVHCSVGTPHYTLEPGVGAAGVAKRLAREVSRQGPGYLRLGETVIGFECPTATDEGETVPASVVVKCLSGDIAVDQVVIATQPKAAVALLDMLDQALLAGRNMAERKRLKRMISALAEVDSRETIVVTHRDYDVLPLDPDLREINLHLPVVTRVDPVETSTPPLSPSSTSVASSRPSTPLDGAPISTPFFSPSLGSVYTMATHVIRPPIGLEQQRSVLQTTNPVMAIDAGKVLSVSRFERALPMSDPMYTFANLHSASRSALVHLAGSYAHPGIPLLEGCVGSAIRATQAVLSTEPRGLAAPAARTKASTLGGVDWKTGQGSLIGRLWRWRREPAEYRKYV